MSFLCPRGTSHWPHPRSGSAPGCQCPVITWMKLVFLLFWLFTFLLAREFSILSTGEEVFVLGFFISFFASFVCCRRCSILSFSLSFFIHLWLGYLQARNVAKGDKLENRLQKLSRSPWIYPSTLTKEASKSNVVPPAQGWRLHLFL